MKSFNRFVTAKDGVILCTSAVAVFFISGLLTKAYAQQLTSASAENKATDQPSATDERYRIGPGDVLEVLVFNHPTLSRPAIRVDGRGMIRMPLLEGEIKAGCKTESELAADLTKRYEEYQKYPQVDVFVKEFNSQPVAVLGAVRTPGRFQLQRRVRLLELLTFSGGASGTAGRTIQIVHGATSPSSCDPENSAANQEEEELATYRLSDTLKGVEASNPYLAPGDVVYVPEAEQIFVVGNVPKPAAIALQETLTVSRAISMAGGFLPNSEQQKVRIIRRTSETGPKTELIVNIQAINKGTAEDVVLLANDVVEVRKEGGAKSVLKGFMGAIVPGILTMPPRVIY